MQIISSAILISIFVALISFLGKLYTAGILNKTCWTLPSVSNYFHILQQFHILTYLTQLKLLMTKFLCWLQTQCFASDYFHFIEKLNPKTSSAFFRSSDQRCSMKKGVLRNFAKFTGKYLCQSKTETLTQVFCSVTLTQAFC